MKASPELREKMWELCYDLLPEGERSALIAQIKSDPHAARLYAEVRLQADLVGYAAAVDDPSLILTADAEKLKTADPAPAAGRRKEAIGPAAGGGSNAAGKSAGKSLWAANAVAIAAGLALVLLLGVGFFRPSDVAQQVAQLVVTEVEVPSRLTPGVTSRFAVRTATPSRQPVSVLVDVRAIDASGQTRFHEMVATPASGEGLFEVPGEAILPGTRLQVEALGDGRGESPGAIEQQGEQQVAQQEGQNGRAGEVLAANRFDTHLPVAEVPAVTYYWIDRPVAAEGEGVQVYGLAIDPFIFVQRPAPVDEIEVQDAESTRRMLPEWSVNPATNLAEGTIRYRKSAEVARSDQLVEGQAEQKKNGEKDETRLSLLKIARAKDATDASLYERKLESRGSSDGITYGMNPGAPRSRTAAAPGNVALSNAAAGDAAPFDDATAALAQSAPKAGAAGAAAPAAAVGGASSAEADKAIAASRDAAKETAEKLSTTLGSDQRTQFEERAPAQQMARHYSEAHLALESHSIKQKRELVETGKPLEVEVPIEQSGKRLEAIVKARGVEVLRQQLQPHVERSATSGKAIAERAKIALDVPPEVDGNVDMFVVDPVAKKVLLKRELYRQPSRELKIEPINHKARYEPGELVQLRLKVVNEQGRPATQTALAARVWNEDYVPDDRSQIVMLDDWVRKSVQLDGLADEGEMLAERGGSNERFGAMLAFGEGGPKSMGTAPAQPADAPQPADAASPKEGDAAKPPVSRLAKSDVRESVTDQKQAQEAAAGTLPAAAPAIAATPSPAASPLATTPPPAAPLPEQPLPESPAPNATVPPAGPQVARVDNQAVDRLQSAVELESNREADVAGTSDYALSEFGYVASYTPLTVSNELAVHERLDSLKSEEDRALAAWRLMFGRVLIGGGLVALAILGVLFLLQQEVRWSSGTLALVASAACLVIGAFWTTGGRQERMIAMTTGSQQAADSYAAMDSATAAPAEVQAKAAAPAGGGGAWAESMREPESAGIDALPSSGAAPLAADPVANSEPLPAEAGTDDIPASRSFSAPTRGVLGGFGGGEPRDRAGSGLESQALGGRGRGGQAPAGPPPGGAPAGAGGSPAPPEVAKALPAGAATPPRPVEAMPLKPSEEPAPPAPATADRPNATRRAGRPAAAADLDAAAATPPGLTPPAAEPVREELAGAPSAIYFNPQLTTAADGTVTIEFRLPTVASEYRVLLDAYGNGRVGSSAELRIVCKAAE